MSKALQEGAKRLHGWLMDEAFDLWWTKGADHNGGGFFETLSLQGEPIASDRRARVQARQIYVYATAGQLGWGGPWRAALEHGLDYFLKGYLRPDGLFRTLVHNDGSAADDTAWLYDQAFGLLAMAEAHQHFPGQSLYKDTAHALLGALQGRRLASGGFLEAAPQHPYQSNPHMHLLEAALAWRELDPQSKWDGLVDEIVGLCLTRFIDRNGGLHEFFAEDWSLEPGVSGRIVEPGHQFEWAWLLQRWSKLRARDDAHLAAKRLFSIGSTHGVDRARGVAFDQLLDDYSIHQPNARLWPQTERIKAGLIMSKVASGQDERERCEAETVAAIEGLELFLAVPVKGLWRDKMQPDGAFIQEPAPASSFYHIVCAINELTTHVLP